MKAKLSSDDWEIVAISTMSFFLAHFRDVVIYLSSFGHVGVICYDHLDMLE